MLLSTSSSKPALRHILVFLGGAALLLAAVETGARWYVHRLSRIEARVAAEHRAALRIRSTGQRPRQLLLVGHSQLEESIPATRIKPDWLQGWQVKRFPIEKTSPLDWTYGLARLRQDGSRPDVFGLVMSPAYLGGNPFSRGDYAALYLLRLQDVPAISSQLHLHPTSISSLVLAIHSKFLAVRVDVRKVLLGRILPGMVELASLIVPRGPAEPVDQEALYRRAKTRIQAIRTVAGREGFRVILILHPPSPFSEEGGTAEILRAAREVGLEVVAPDPGTPFQKPDFRDSQHLNESGAEKFIRSITPGLQAALDRLVP